MGRGTMAKRTLSFLFVYIFLQVAPGVANAFPLAKHSRPLVHFSRGSSYNFEGIVALDDCSGSLVQFENSAGSDAAMVLTNGHCLEGGMPNPGQAITHESSSRQFEVLDASANA